MYRLQNHTLDLPTPQTRVILKPFVQSPVTTSGQPEEPKQYQTLHQLEKKIDRVACQVSHTNTKVDSISNRLAQMYIHL